MWDIEKQKEINDNASNYTKKINGLKFEVANLWMMYEDNLALLLKKDDQINEMKTQIKGDQDRIKKLENDAESINNSYKSSFKRMDEQKEEINLLKNQLTDFRKNDDNLKNIIKVSKQKEE